MSKNTTCPGHHLAQHRDGRSKWCDRCGCGKGGIPKDQMPGLGDQPKKKALIIDPDQVHDAVGEETYEMDQA